LVTKVRRHPLFRALRVDKLTITVMEATLRAYLREAWEEIPAQRMIRASLGEIARRTARFVEGVEERLRDAGARVEIVDGQSLVGGGSTPAQGLPTKLLRLRSGRIKATELEARLRDAKIPVIAGIEDEGVLLDLRTVFAEQEPLLAEELCAAIRCE